MRSLINGTVHPQIKFTFFSTVPQFVQLLLNIMEQDEMWSSKNQRHTSKKKVGPTYSPSYLNDLVQGCQTCFTHTTHFDIKWARPKKRPFPSD